MQSTKCPICETPRVVEYMEMDQETSTVVKKSHTVECLGHYGVHAFFWKGAPCNSVSGVRSLGYDDFHKNDKPRKLVKIELPPRKVKKYVKKQTRGKDSYEREEKKRPFRRGKNRPQGRR